MKLYFIRHCEEAQPMWQSMANSAPWTATRLWCFRLLYEWYWEFITLVADPVFL